MAQDIEIDTSWYVGRAALFSMVGASDPSLRDFVDHVTPEILRRVPVGSTFSLSSFPAYTFYHLRDSEGKHYIATAPAAGYKGRIYLTVESPTGLSGFLDQLREGANFIKDPGGHIRSWFDEKVDQITQ